MAITAKLHSVVRTSGGADDHRDKDADSDGEIDVCEYWTLARDGDGWRLVSIEQEAEGSHHLDATIVAAPWSDDPRLPTSRSSSSRRPTRRREGTNVSELVSVEFDGTAREQALDLALADPRCAPDVLEIAARRAVEAWAEAVDGDDAALLALATPEAAQALLYPRGEGRARRRARPAVQRLAIVALHPDGASPRMDVEATCAAGATSRTATRRRCCRARRTPRRVQRALDVRARGPAGRAVAADQVRVSFL